MSYQIALQFHWTSSPAQCFSINGSSIGWKSGKVPEPKADPIRKTIKCPMKQPKRLAIGPSRFVILPNMSLWMFVGGCWKAIPSRVGCRTEKPSPGALCSDGGTKKIHGPWVGSFSSVCPDRWWNRSYQGHELRIFWRVYWSSIINLNQPVKGLVWQSSTFWKQPLTIHFSLSVRDTANISASVLTWTQFWTHPETLRVFNPWAVKGEM